jgi:Peptidase M16 inactive domain
MKRTPASLGFLVVIGLLQALAGTLQDRILFPYDVGLEVLPNGLTIVTVPVNPSKEISYFTIFRMPGGTGLDRGDPAEAELFARIGAETRRLLGEDVTGDFVSFCGRDNLADVVRAEAARILRMSQPRAGGAGAAFPGANPSPADTILLVTGDISREELLPLVRDAYARWGGGTAPPIPPAKEGPSERLPDILDSPGPASVRLAFRGPAFSDRELDKAALDLFATAAFSSSSPLARKLVLEDGRCLSLRAVFADGRSAGSFIVEAEAREARDRPFVEDAIKRELERLREETLSSRVLAAAASNRKASLAVSIGSTGGMARVLAHYLALTGDPATIDRLFALYERITPLEVRAMVRKYLRPDNMILSPGQAGRP